MHPTNPVLHLSPEVRTQRLKASHEKGDRVKESTRHPGEWLVSSSQYPNLWYRVRYDTTAREYSCGCTWFQRTHAACRHLVRVSYELHCQSRVTRKAVS
jgi:hypothetical protein